MPQIAHRKIGKMSTLTRSFDVVLYVKANQSLLLGAFRMLRAGQEKRIASTIYDRKLETKYAKIFENRYLMKNLNKSLIVYDAQYKKARAAMPGPSWYFHLTVCDQAMACSAAR